MDFLYDFIINNTTSIIMVAIILAMALVGYIAEENGFGKKSDTKEEEGLEPADIPQDNNEVEIVDAILEENVNVEKQDDKEESTDNLEEKKTNEEKQPVNEEKKLKEEDNKSKANKESLNIDKDFSKLLDDEIIEEDNEEKLIDIDDDLWKF